MRKDVPPSRTERIIKVANDKTGKVEISPELKELYGQLAKVTIASRKAGRLAREKPSPSAEREYWDLDLELDAIIRRINRLIG